MGGVGAGGLGQGSSVFTVTSAQDVAAAKEHIARLLKELEAPPPVLASEEERAKRQEVVHNTQTALVELFRDEASRALVAGEFSAAMAAARQALSFAIKVWGESALEVVPCYLLLAEGAVGARKFEQAQELLAMGNWTIVSAGGAVPHVLRSAMHRNYAKLYAAQGKLDQALREMARDAYYCALAVGPEHIDTSAAYFHLASIYLNMQPPKQEAALAALDTVVSIWYKFLAAAQASGAAADGLLHSQQLEAAAMLQAAVDTRTKLLGRDHVAVAEALHTLAQLHAWRHLWMEAEAAAQDALEIYQSVLGPSHATCEEVDAFVTAMRASAVAELP